MTILKIYVKTWTRNKWTAQIKLKKNKSPGEDNILNHYILEDRTVIDTLLCKLFNVIRVNGSFPEHWVTNDVV